MLMSNRRVQVGKRDVECRLVAQSIVRVESMIKRVASKMARYLLRETNAQRLVPS